MNDINKHIYSILLSAAILIAGIPCSIFAAWDGYDDGGAVNTSIVDFNSFMDVRNFGALPTSENRFGDNKYSARWANQTANGILKINDLARRVPTDWSQYESVIMNIYSKKATGSEIAVVVHNPKGASNTPYQIKRFLIDWEGWKKIELPLSGFSAAYSATWGNMSSFWLVAHGEWSLTADPEADLYIGSIDLYTKDKSDFVKYFYDEEKIEKTFEDLEGSVGVYVGGANAVTGDGVQKISYSIDQKDGTVMVPTKFFEDYFDVEVNTSLFGAETYQKDDFTYVPAEKAAKLSGLCALADGKLFVCGDKKAYDALKRPGNLGVNEENEITAYLAKRNDVDVSSFTAEDYAKIKENWLKYIVGNSELNDLNNADIKSRIEGITASAESARKLLIKNPSSTELFEGIVSDRSGAMTTAYSMICKMAKAYGCFGSELYKDKGLKNDILYALEWMYNYRYGKNTSNLEIWKFSGHNNWWDWDIGAPQNLIPTIMLMEEDLTEEEIAKYLKYFDQRNWFPKLTGANFVDIAQFVIGSAALQKQGERILQTEVMLEKLYLYVDDGVRVTENQLEKERQSYTKVKGSGFFTDGSYVLHTLHAMNGGYGATHLHGLCFFSQLFDGTKFRLQSSLQDNLPNFFYDSIDSVQFGTVVFRNVLGRTEGGNDKYVIDNNSIVSIFNAAPSFDEENANKIYSIVKRIVLDTPDINWAGKLSFEGIIKLNEIMNDDSIIPRDDVFMDKVFYNMDKVVHKSGKWAFAISMSSSRMFNYESINNMNMKGWYQGDGRTEWYTLDNSSNGAAKYWSSIDPYRLPGTTVDTQEREAVSIVQGYEYLSSKDFVGGTNIDDKYGTSAMWLESYHEDKEPTIKTSDYGGGRPVHKCDLTAKKSYFMFDDEVVCLGSAVDAKDNNNAEVLTIVDNLLAQKTKNQSGDGINAEPYTIISAVASETPEPENVAENTIDSNPSSKWAAEMDAEIVWDLGEVKDLGYIGLSLLNGSKRKQIFILQTSEDGIEWTTVFDGSSSGTTEVFEYYDLQNQKGRYVKYINKGNSAGSAWVSITETLIFPLNNDGSVGVNQEDIYGDDAVIVDGSDVKFLDNDYSFGDASWINVGDACGYVFPKENSENLGELKGRWTKGATSHCEIWFSHGVNPTDGKYAYILLPGKTAEETRSYAENRAVTVIENNSSIQAVYNEKLGITGIVFWEAGECMGVKAQQPCIVMIKDGEENLKVSVCDPTQKLKEINVQINRDLNPANIDEQATSETKNGNIYIKILPDETTVGRTYKMEYGMEAADANAYYKDLWKATWAKEAVEALTDKGIIAGDGSGYFRPNDNVTREEFVKMLISALGAYDENAKCEFEDIDNGLWCYPYVASAVKGGIVNGISKTEFGYKKLLTRQDMAVLCFNAISFEENGTDAAPADEEKISDYAKDAVKTLFSAGIINGMGDGEFMPFEFSTRAQCAVLINNILSANLTVENEGGEIL